MNKRERLLQMCACYIRLHSWQSPTQQSAQTVDCNMFLSLLSDGDGAGGAVVRAALRIVF